MPNRILNSLVVCFFLSATTFAQEVKRYKLSESLNEISGLEQINDSTFVAINDGGNKPIIFLLNAHGKILKKVKVVDAENTDWEDIAIDNKHLYIGDFGNNENKRKKLVIYRVKIKDLLKGKEVESKKIKFSYPDQTKFPPSKKKFNFDAEALVCDENSLIVFTKCNTDPWTGKAFAYKIPKEPGTYVAKKKKEIYIGPNGWGMDAITAADYYEGKFYVSTYNRIIILKYANKKYSFVKELFFDDISQKESIVVLTKNTAFVADEKHRLLGGGFLIKYKIPHD
ncbi:MAG: hypothetical protein P8N52_08675 [Crocinitomicaceae bacterium]|nr:hypothetical protein [Crocinitomicaceae bacterium]MDG1776768.1 hypothetical protein [Crocinitomicaceae bacterium]